MSLFQLHALSFVWSNVTWLWSWSTILLTLKVQRSKFSLQEIQTPIMFEVHKSPFLLLAHYVPNVVKSSIWDQCKKKYILKTDRPTNDRPTSQGSHRGKFQMAISPQGVVQSTSCLVQRWGFRGRRIEWRYFWFRQIQDGDSAAIFTPCLVLGWGFRRRRIEWR